MDPRAQMTLLTVAVAAGPAWGAGTVLSVSPGNMRGWVVVTNKGARAGLVNHGPAVCERLNAFTAEDGRKLGKGAYYATLPFKAGATPATAWLGVDTFRGRPLAGAALRRITAMEYYAYNAHLPVRTSNPKHWTSWKGWWTYPRQLIQLQLTACSPDGKRRKQFWFLPWQKFKIRGENCGRHCKKWLRYDAIRFNHPGGCMVGRWFTFGPPRQQFASWADVVRAYGDWVLAPTSTVSFARGGWRSAGWDKTTDPPGAPACTATGMCLNFVVGARKGREAVFEPEVTQWSNDHRGFKGYVDWFTLGVDGKNVTYNFEPSPSARPPRVIPMSNKEAMKLKPDSTDLVEISGTVVERTGAMFALDDGSGPIIRGFLYKDIKTPENPARVGQRWRVRGHMERVPFQPAGEPPLIWTCVEHMKRWRRQGTSD